MWIFKATATCWACGWEGATQWAAMLTELANRGLADALIVCCDGLAGLPESIRATWPNATVQTCVVHMVRNSLRYSSRKHWGPITKAMRDIYTSPTVEAAEARFEAFAADWEHTYPAMIGSWRKAWDEFTPFLEFPAEPRRVVYTTNAIESLNARFRRAVRYRGHFPNEQAAMKAHLPCRHPPTQEPHQPDRQDQRLESHPEHTDRPLRRPDRRPHPMNTITPGYTENLTVPEPFIRQVRTVSFQPRVHPSRPNSSVDRIAMRVDTGCRRAAVSRPCCASDALAS